MFELLVRFNTLKKKNGTGFLLTVCLLRVTVLLEKIAALLARGILGDTKCPITSCKFQFVSVDYLTCFRTKMLYS